MEPLKNICCLCCGNHKLEHRDILWPELIDSWRLAPYEVDYINRQQGLHCPACSTNLRAMALAGAVMRCFRFDGCFQEFVADPRFAALRVLEINQSGALTHFLRKMPGHLLREYPEIDMLQLPFEAASFDLVVHSDTLEHVPSPVRGLSECRRVLKEIGACIFTVPVVVDRLTISREGMPPSYHGNPDDAPTDMLVQTEYGCDVWKHVVLAGFSECRVFCLDYPAAHAISALK
jgi:SAM-dependent methyltransferase